MKIGSKIKRYIFFTVNGLLFSVLTAFSLEFYSVSLKSTHELAFRISEVWASRFKNILSDPLGGIRDLRKVFLRKGLLNRASAIDLLRTHTEEKEKLVGTYIAFEPNAFDGQDAAYVNTAGHDSTGRFVPYLVRNREGRIILEPTTEYDTVDWYNLPKKSLKNHLTEPYYDTIEGKYLFLTSISLPLVRDGQFLGTIGVDLTLDFLQMEYGKTKPYKDSGYINLISNAGVYIINGLDERLKSKSVKDLPNGSEIMKNLSEKGSFIYEDSEYYHVILSVELDNTVEKWYVETAFSKNELFFDTFKEIIIIIVGAIILSVFGALFFNRLLNSMIYSPLNKAVRISKQIADGDLNVLEEIQETGEMGILLTSIRSIAVNNSVLVKELKNSNLHILQTARFLLESAKQIQKGSEKQTESAINTNSASVQLSRSSDSIESSMILAKKNLDSIELSISELNDSIHQISSGMVEFEKLAKSSSLQAKKGTEAVDRAASAMNAIMQTTKEISKFSRIISEISGRTNLLALNAAIESARAGEAGKGFSVVADEVAKLAGSTVESVRSISSLMREAEESVRNGILQINDTINIFKSIISNVEMLNASSGEITKEVLEQSDNSVRISSNLNSLSSLTEEILHSSTDQKKSSKEIQSSLNSATEVSRTVLENSEKLSEIAEKLNLQSETMEEMIQRFRID